MICLLTCVRVVIVPWVTQDEPGSSTVVYWAERKSKNTKPLGEQLPTNIITTLLYSFIIAIL